MINSIRRLASCCALGLLPVSLECRSYAAETIALDSRVAIVVVADEPPAVHAAAADLAVDFEKALGTRPGVTEKYNNGPDTVLIGENAKLPESMRSTNISAPESFSIAVYGKTVVLSGADMRGAIYSIYQFSEDYLGVAPMYFWTDGRPPRRSRIQIPATLNRSFGPPVFRYRGFFINDEDLLTGWAPGEKKDGTGISLAAWDKVYETILRLKGNMVVPGTWIFPDDAQIWAAGERGLIVTQHHAIPLGLNVARGPATCLTTIPRIRRLRQMMLTYMIDAPLYAIPGQAPKWEVPRLIGSGYGPPESKEWLEQTAAKEIEQCGNAQQRWDAVWQKALAAEPLVAPERRAFYQAGVLTMIAINRESNRMLTLVSRSVLDARNGRLDQAGQEAAQAEAALENVRRAQLAAEYGKWKNWYRGDWLTGVYRTEQMIRVFANYLRDPLTHLGPPVVWNGWEAYYHIMHYEGGRTVDVK